MFACSAWLGRIFPRIGAHAAEGSSRCRTCTVIVISPSSSFGNRSSHSAGGAASIRPSVCARRSRASRGGPGFILFWLPSSETRPLWKLFSRCPRLTIRAKAGWPFGPRRGWGTERVLRASLNNREWSVVVRRPRTIAAQNNVTACNRGSSSALFATRPLVGGPEEAMLSLLSRNCLHQRWRTCVADHPHRNFPPEHSTGRSIEPTSFHVGCATGVAADVGFSRFSEISLALIFRESQRRRLFPISQRL